MDASGEVKPHCKGQYFDFWKVGPAQPASASCLCLTLTCQCMDKCTAPKLFAALK